MGKLFVNVGLFLFVVFSILLCILYFGLLYDKITRPTFKNMNAEGFQWGGLLVGIFLVVDIFILRSFLRRLKK